MGKGRKKIVMIIPSLGRGGAERSFCNVSNELSKEYDVLNIVFNKDERISFPLRAELASLDVPGGANLLSKATNFFKRVRRLKRIKRKFGADISISFLQGADLINILSRQKDKVVVSIRGSLQFDWQNIGWYGFINRWLVIPLVYRFAQRVVTVNEGIRWEFNKYFHVNPKKVTVIPNFYSLAELQRLGEESLSSDLQLFFKNEYLVISSRLSKEKNVLFLLKVFHGLVRRGYEGNLLVIGDGPERQRLIDYCKNEEIPSWEMGEPQTGSARVFFVGSQPNPLMFLRGADAFLMASVSEGFPNAIIEAMSQQVLVVAADCPWGPRELITDGFTPEQSFLNDPIVGKNGILMSRYTGLEADIEIWGDYLIKILNDAQLVKTIKANALKRLNEFTTEAVVQKWVSVLEE
jgi:glycosyltransferase involved in cell wall biosynthesis